MAHYIRFRLYRSGRCSSQSPLLPLLWADVSCVADSSVSFPQWKSLHLARLHPTPLPSCARVGTALGCLRLGSADRNPVPRTPQSLAVPRRQICPGGAQQAVGNVSPRCRRRGPGGTVLRGCSGPTDGTCPGRGAGPCPSLLRSCGTAGSRLPCGARGLECARLRLAQ